MRKLVIVVALLAALGVHLVQRGADEERWATSVENELLFLPSPQTFRLATMGYHEPASDLLWMRAVLLFGEHHGMDGDPGWGMWLAGMIEAIAALDPQWRTPYYYGGTMLRSIEAIDASDRIFELAIEAMPDDAFFYFALGMNHYLHRGDPQTAVQWITLAATKPNARPWYRVAAAGMLADRDMLPMAIRFLEEQRETTDDPAILEMIDGRLEGLRHDALVMALEEARRGYRLRFGADIERVEDLERLGRALPADPHGEQWIIGADDAIRSSHRERDEARRGRESERRKLRRK
jgi:tetratricopeptide (TPR) repeat protein